MAENRSPEECARIAEEQLTTAYPNSPRNALAWAQLGLLKLSLRELERHEA